MKKIIVEMRSKLEGNDAEVAKRANALSEEIDALCKKHGFTLDHEDSQGAFILVEAPEGKGGFCGASAIVPVGGDRRRPRYL